MKVALVITIKNEERLLRSNLLYHIRIGIERVFVYLDGTNDNSVKTIKDLKKAKVYNSVNPDEFKNKSYLEKFWTQAKNHHTARQCLNTYDALQKSKELGFDWLISLDADELFVMDAKGKVSLESFFKEAETKNAELVYFRTVEVISRKIHYQNVLSEETLFKTKKNFESNFDQIYFKIRNPFIDKNISQSYWLGHNMGKAAIKVKSEIIPKNVHRYQAKNGIDLTSINLGLLLHYHVYDFEDFLKKYQNFKHRPEVYLSGNKINGLKSLWIKLVNDPSYSKEYLKNYYIKNLLFDERKLKRLNKTRFGNFFKRKESASVTIEHPREILNKLRNK